MTICFDKKIIIKEFNNYSYHIQYHKCKDFDGPNNFSIFWNQLLILALNDKIKNKIDLLERFNLKILKSFQNEIIKRLDIIILKFRDLKFNSIKLYYNQYKILNNEINLNKIKFLKDLINVL
tara:strand:+ start:1260 stop:1625 length:366 start_codon:yes stop_codon:yes gene_type:complete